MSAIHDNDIDVVLSVHAWLQCAPAFLDAMKPTFNWQVANEQLPFVK